MNEIISKISLRTRLTIWYGAIVFLTLIGFGYWIYSEVRSDLQQNLDASLYDYAGILKSYVSKQLPVANEPNYQAKSHAGLEKMRAARYEDSLLMAAFIRDLNKQAPYHPQNFYVQIATFDGSVIWRSLNLKGKSLPQPASYSQLARINRDSLRGVEYRTYKYTPKVLAHPFMTGKAGDSIFAAVQFDGQPVRLFAIRTPNATIVAGFPLTETNRTLSAIMRAMAFSIPLILFISGLGGYLIAKYSLKPLDEINKTALAITANRLSARIPQSGADDELNRLSITLNKMIERLERSFEQVKRFTSDASHELRTPLTILRGELEVALREEHTEEDYQVILLSALEEVNRLTNVVEMLLELSRADTGQLVLKLRNDNLSKLLMDICEDAEILAEMRNIKVVTKVQQDIFLPFDSPRLHQALINLVDNAIKYNVENGELRIELKTEGDSAVITIADTGHGMTEDSVKHIFERFYRVHTNKTKGIQGNGLGLSIVKWIVDSHRGMISVESKLGEGTAFTIKLPYTENSNEPVIENANIAKN